ncbi:hypothetical protein GH714_004061 [Hevea brasiliensis]|uniref:ER lumen protein-retaining receptor n=1 Tax=Hevea brasiliensis TaxID=3981 RepID=A0A6A6KJ02_HEVBR|nr:hypothetical protein GH714_004061 [Hevea brasiliensis]
MRYHKVVKQTYSKDEDTFRHYILILLCFVLALLIHRSFDVIEVLWAFSIYLEAVAILPQLLLLQRSRNIDNLTVNYVFLLGAYRALYIVNWIYRFFVEGINFRWILYIVICATPVDSEYGFNLKPDDSDHNAFLRCSEI